MNLRALTLALTTTALLATGCLSDDEGIYLLRVDNQRAETVQFRYGQTNFGSIDADSISLYVEVDPGPDNIFVDGEMIHEDLRLGRNLVGEHFWTYTLQDLAHGLSADEPQR